MAFNEDGSIKDFWQKVQEQSEEDTQAQESPATVENLEKRAKKAFQRKQQRKKKRSAASKPTMSESKDAPNTKPAATESNSGSSNASKASVQQGEHAGNRQEFCFGTFMARRQELRAKRHDKLTESNTESNTKLLAANKDLAKMANEKDDEDLELVLQYMAGPRQNLVAGTGMVTPASSRVSTPASSRCSSPTIFGSDTDFISAYAVPTAFKTPAKDAKMNQNLSPMLEGSGEKESPEGKQRVRPKQAVADPATGETTSNETDAKQPARKKQAVAEPATGKPTGVSVANKNFHFVAILGSRMNGANVWASAGQTLTEEFRLVKSIVQVEDVTCFLMSNGTIVPRIRQVTSLFSSTATARFQQSPLSGFEGVTINYIAAAGKRLFARSEDGQAFCCFYKGGGKFGKPTALGMQGHVGAVGVTRNCVYYVRQEDLTENIQAPLRVSPLDEQNGGTLLLLDNHGIGAERSVPSVGEITEWSLPKKKVEACAFTGNDQCPVVAFDGDGKGSLFMVKKRDNFGRVAKFKNGHVEKNHVAADAEHVYVHNKDGGICWSLNHGKTWDSYKDAKTPLIKKLYAGAGYCFGVTSDHQVAIMYPMENDMDLRWMKNLNPEVVKIMYCTGSQEFACILAVVETNADGVVKGLADAMG